MNDNDNFGWGNFAPLNRLNRSQLATIYALDQVFVTNRIETEENFALKFDDRAFLECLCNRHTFLEQFSTAARASEISPNVYNLRIKLRPDCMFEAYIDEAWHDLIAIEAVALDQNLSREAALAQPRSLDIVAVELLQSGWCQLSLDAHLHLRQGLLAKHIVSVDLAAAEDVENHASSNLESSIMMRLN